MAGQVYMAKVMLERRQVRALIDAGLSFAREQALPPLTMVVLDAGGNVVVAEREDGCSALRYAVALGKANAALGMGISSGTIGARNAERPAFLASVATAAEGCFVPVAGGVLILDSDDCVIGAVGVSGASSEEDQQVASHGIESLRWKVGLAPD
uniref:GlcG/HbpS family heme-binding protein n=1 Tax=Halomonas sp. TaxID=1486246 RepID=UPI002639FDE8|nr:heme-binding protein [Halomonas sp.]